MSQHTDEKVQRLLREGRVDPMPPTVIQHFRVKGDTDTYDVLVGPHYRFCHCEGWRQGLECSHMQAVLEWVFAQYDRQEGKSNRARLYEDALDARRLAEKEKADAVFDQLERSA